MGVFIERDQVSIGVEYGEFFCTPWLACQLGIRMHDGLVRALGVQCFDCLDLHSAACCFSNLSICAGPEVNFYRTVGNNAVLALDYVYFAETELGGEELRASLDIKRRENRDCGNELDGPAHMGFLTFNENANGNFSKTIADGDHLSEGPVSLLRSPSMTCP